MMVERSPSQGYTLTQPTGKGGDPTPRGVLARILRGAALLRHSLIVNNFLKKPLDFMLKMGYIITMKEMIKKDEIFTVTFTDGGEVFIQAQDEAHARRIIMANGLWSRNLDCGKFSRTIKKIEKANR